MPRPFYNKKFEFSQADGTKIHLIGWGNQLFATFETEDGYTVVKNPVTEFYDYAKLSADNSYLETTGVRVGTADPATLGISKHLRISEPAATAMARATFGGETGRLAGRSGSGKKRPQKKWRWPLGASLPPPLSVRPKAIMWAFASSSNFLTFQAPFPLGG